MKSYFLFYACILLAFVSCNKLSEEEQKFDAIMEEVISVHDEVMPKMGEISSLIKELEPKTDTTTAATPYIQAQQDLKDAYDFMMTWMSDFSEKFPHDEETDAKEISSQIELLKEEKIEVNKLKDQINSSIRNAKRLLNKS
ncbi:hypothetical protein J8281_14500 [Aquimarina sp. U1-2]|uniref:hypothetical protein n=1 Tax=Aquimarina sp. U1-2 TaxID=2823141 RepID=UPI001AECFEC2|nr:hypothetical protein [Aquimarina sp. U1-2]MBP2833402.1 hypothetical protein [Aquimarina sp. U1-2]